MKDFSTNPEFKDKPRDRAQDVVFVRLTGFFGFGIFLIACAYFYVSWVNLFFPIASWVAAVILTLAIVSALFIGKKVDLDVFSGPPDLTKISRPGVVAALAALVAWAIVVMFRPTADVDSNVYHLPLSLLINHSRWYAGIGKLCHHYGFPNADSVLASVFTSTGVAGFENIANFFIWVIFGAGIFLYLTAKKIKAIVSFWLAMMFILTPDLFWQSYNMGTDMAQACFLVFGLLAFKEDRLDQAWLFFAMSAMFKHLGIIALGLTAVYLVWQLAARKINRDIFIRPVFLLGSAIIFTVMLRAFVATGNPVYPVGGWNFAGWGISPVAQQEMVEGSLRYYSEVQRSLPGFIALIKSLLVSPHQFKSSFWFSPFLLVCLFAAAGRLLSARRDFKVQARYSYLGFMLLVLLAAWFWASPLVRFIAGPLVFVSISLFVYVYHNVSSQLLRRAVCAGLVLTLAAFTFNVFRHFKNYVRPLMFASPEKAAANMPFGPDIFSTVRSPDGFVYSKSSSNYCGRMESPCLSRYSVGGEDELIMEYRRQNRL